MTSRRVKYGEMSMRIEAFINEAVEEAFPTNPHPLTNPPCVVPYDGGVEMRRHCQQQIREWVRPLIKRCIDDAAEDRDFFETRCPECGAHMEDDE